MRMLIRNEKDANEHKNDAAQCRHRLPISFALCFIHHRRRGTSFFGSFTSSSKSSFQLSNLFFLNPMSQMFCECWWMVIVPPCSKVDASRTQCFAGFFLPGIASSTQSVKPLLPTSRYAEMNVAPF